MRSWLGCVFLFSLSRLVTSDISYSFNPCKAPTVPFTDVSQCVADPNNPNLWYYFYCCSDAYIGTTCFNGVEVYLTPNCSGAYSTYFNLPPDGGCVSFGRPMYPAIDGWNNNIDASILTMNCTGGTGSNRKQGAYGFYGNGCKKPLTSTFADSACLAAPTMGSRSLQFSCDMYNFLNVALDNSTQHCTSLLPKHLEPTKTCFFDWDHLLFPGIPEYKGFIYADCEAPKRALFMSTGKFPNGTLPSSTATIVPTGAAKTVTMTAVRGALGKQYLAINQQLADLTGCPWNEFAPAINTPIQLRSVSAYSAVQITITPSTNAPVYLYIKDLPQGTYAFSYSSFVVKASSITDSSIFDFSGAHPVITIGPTANLSAILEFPIGTRVIKWNGTPAVNAQKVAFIVAYVVPQQTVVPPAP